MGRFLTKLFDLALSILIILLLCWGLAWIFSGDKTNIEYSLKITSRCLLVLIVLNIFYGFKRD